MNKKKVMRKAFYGNAFCSVRNIKERKGCCINCVHASARVCVYTRGDAEKFSVQPRWY